MIAAHAVNAALRGVGKHAFFQTGLANFLSDVLLSWERLARGFVFDEFDAKEETEATDFTDMDVRLKWRKRDAEILCGGSHAIKELVRFEVVENGVARGSTNRMRLISEAVHEGAGAAFECFDDARGNENRAERRVTAGDSFSYQDDVRLDAPVLRSKRLSGTAHAGHNFVGDQENTVLAADFRDARGVTFGRHGGAESGADDRFKDKSGGLTGLLFEQLDLKIVGARDLAFRKSFFERAVVAETRSDVTPFRDERLVRRAAGDISAYGHRAKSAAVIALSAGKNAVAILLAAFEVKLAREFYGGFGRFGAAGSEIDAATVTKIRRSHREQPLGEFFRRSGVKLRSVRESDLRRLLGHGAADFRDTVTDAHDRGLAGGVEEAAAVGSDDPATFPAKGNRKSLLEITGEKSAAHRHEVSGKGL